MRNLLNKLVLPLAFSSALVCSINSNAQDFLPGKFRDYTERKVLIYGDIKTLDCGDDIFMETLKYDVDGDSICDVIELSLVKFQKGKVITSDYPYAYYLDLDPNNEYLKTFFDPEMDGWNNNEEIISNEETIDYSKLPL